MLQIKFRWSLPVALNSGLQLDPISGLQLDAQNSVPCDFYGLVHDAVGSFSPGAPFVGDVVRPRGSFLTPASQTPPPSALTSSEASRPALPPRSLPSQSLPPPSEGRDRSGEVEGVHRVGSR